MTQILSHRQTGSLTTCDGRVNIWEGAVRSGKTFVSIIAFLMAIANAGTGGEIVITGKNRDSIFRNFFRVIEQAAGLRALRDHVQYRQGAPTATILGRTVHVIGANDAKAEAVIRGMTVLLAYADELTVLPEAFFKQLLARMSPPGARLYATTNPDSSRHWLKVDYLDKLDQLPTWRRFKFTMDDNPSLTDTYRESLKAEYTGLWYKRFILGQWVAAEGAVYDAFDPDTHTLTWDNLPTPVELVAAGIDYGTTNPTVSIRLGVFDLPTHGRALVAVDEWINRTGQTGRAATDTELSQGIRNHLASPATPNWQTPPTLIAVDPAAASFRAQLRADQTPTVAGNNSVVDGIKRINALFGNQKLFITDRCPTLLDELDGYAWDPKQSKKGIDAPIKQNDHAVDALRYAVMTSEHRWRHAI
ncbi:PBSX family phage terminase large subunit [Gulosibacter hominis]|uniref:PBSX family phage terminase large subunit n=1 Tax=Gulosibacter hominis TaxID=2770504 RepID=UPI0022AB31EB|nr:PBSX family phage terminase large subunit [Gulosibacter hominis]